MILEAHFKYFQGAVLMLAALCFWAEAGTKVVPGKLPTEVAKRLFLEKQRKQAVGLLRGAWLNATGKEKDELAELAGRLATMFMTEKGQQLHEEAQSQLPGQPAQALAAIASARPLEEGNLSLELVAARAHLLSDDCDEASKALSAVEGLGFASADWLELSLGALACTEKFNEIDEMLKRKLAAKASPLVTKVTLARGKIASGDNTKATELLAEARAADPQHPLVLYWQWRLRGLENKTRTDEASAFVRLCKTPSPSVKVKIMNTPEICLRLPEVEAYLKQQTPEAGDIGGQ